MNFVGRAGGDLHAEILPLAEQRNSLSSVFSHGES
jgi:hypothetical protein